MKVKVLGLMAIAALLAIAAFAVVSPYSSPEAAAGSLVVEVRMPSEVSLSSVAYTITGPSERTGALSGSSGTAYSTRIAPIRAGSDYVLQLRSAACQGSAQFDVIADQTTSVSVKLHCQPSEATPAADRQGSAPGNRCPRAETVTAVASTSERAMLLTGVATDPDNGPRQLHFQWSATGAKLTDSTEAAASLSCDTGGTHRVKFEVYDGECADVIEQTVTCSDVLARAEGGGPDGKRAGDSERASAEGARHDAPGKSAPAIGAIVQSPMGAHIVQGSVQVQNSVNAATDPGSPGVGTGTPSRGSSSTVTSSVSTAEITRNPNDPKTPCQECESKVHDGNRNCVDSNFRCDNLPGLTDDTLKSPLLAGVPKAALCRRIIDCVRSSRCAAPDHTGTSIPTDCFCGQGVDPEDCFFRRDFAAATGACKELIAIGSETLDTAEIAVRMFEPTYASGAAETVIETCDMLFCSSECL